MTLTAVPRTPTAGLDAPPRLRRVAGGGAVAGLSVAVCLPWLANAYLVSIASTALILAVLAVSAQLLSGVAGLPSMGQAAYAGIGAYTAAILARTVTPAGPVHLLAAAATGALVAGAVGVFAVRTRAITYLMVTIAVGQLVHVAAVQAVTVTGGSDGLRTPPTQAWPGGPALRLDGHTYLYVLACVLLLAVAVGWLRRTRFVLVLRAVAEHEPRARACGHHSGRHLWAAHTIAGGIAGIAGALAVTAHRSVTPTDLSLDVSALAVVAAAIGVRSMPGAALAAIVLVAVRDLTGGILVGYSLTALGVVYLTVAYLPRHRATDLYQRITQRWRTR